MCEILFRGESINGLWVTGLLSKSSGGKGLPEKGWYISNDYGMPFAYMVRPKTVCQYTGKDDCNGKPIFDGDIVKEKEHDIIFLIEWSDESLCYFIKTLKGGRDYLCDIWDCEVIGNRWDNPELLEA